MCLMCVAIADNSFLVLVLDFHWTNIWLDSKVGCQIIVDECLRAEEAKLLMAKEKEKVRVMHDPRRQLFCCSPKQFCSGGCYLAPAAVASFLPILS